MSQADALPPLMAPRREPGKYASLVMTVAVHVLLILFLVYGIRWQTSVPAAVEVQLVASVPPTAAPQPRPAPVPKPVPKVEEEPPPPPPRKPDIALKEKPKPPPKEKPKPAEKTPPKPPQKQPPRDDFEQQMQRELQQEQERIDRQKIKQSATRDLQRFATPNAKQPATAGSAGLADYVGRIQAKVRGNLVLPPGVTGNPEAVFEVRQLPSGEILSVKLKKSSGNTSLDAADERAIWKSSPLPKPDSGEPDPDLILKFKPRED